VTSWLASLLRRWAVLCLKGAQSLDPVATLPANDGGADRMALVRQLYRGVAVQNQELLKLSREFSANYQGPVRGRKQK